MAETSSHLVCSPELATALSPYLLIELDQEVLESMDSSPLVIQPSQLLNNQTTGFSHSSCFSMFENQQLSSFVSVQNGVYVGQFYQKDQPTDMKGGVVLHIDKSCLKLKPRIPQRTLIYKVLQKYPFKAEDSDGISVADLAKGTGISTSQILEIIENDSNFSFKVKQNLELCWLDKRVIDAMGSHLLPLIKSFPLCKEDASDLLQAINQFNEDLLDATLYRLFKHTLSFSDIACIPEDSVFHFDSYRFYLFVVDKMTKDKQDFQLQQFKEVFLQLAQILLAECPEILEKINTELQIDTKENAESNFVHGYEEMNLSFLEGKCCVDIKDEKVYLRFINKLELPSDPKSRAISLAEMKLKWFNRELFTLIDDCFPNETECLKFIKNNYEESSLRSFFNYDKKIPVQVCKLTH